MTATLRRLLDLARAPRRRFLLVVMLGTTTVLCGVGLLSSAGYLISRAAERPPILSLTVAIVVVRCFALARPLSRYLERLSAHDLAFRALARARVRTYERMEPLAPGELAGYRDGDLLSRLVADVDALQTLHLRAVAAPCVALLASAASVGVTAAFLPAAAIVLGAGLVVSIVVVPGVTGAVGRWTERKAAATGDLSAELVELLRGAPELAVYGQAETSLARLRRADRTLVRLARRAALADGAGEGLRLLVGGATVVGVLALAAGAHADGHLDRVLIGTLALLALASFEAVQPLPQAARELRATLAAGRRILALTDHEPRVVDPSDPLPPPAAPFAVELDRVSARYTPGGPAALERASLRLEPGGRIALTGPSGSGKTTVTNLLLRFLDPEAGRVTLGGRDLRELRQEDVRRSIAVAGQDSHLFSATIRENIRFARPEAGDDEVETALRRARIWDWVSRLPEGLDTLVGEEGRELSGGQRQRIVVARALLTDAPVLVLDEPTAHLDPVTAHELIDDVLAAAADRSILLITHRPEGIERMDAVFALGGG